MLGYIARRVLMSIPVLFGILLVTFVLARSIPGDPCKAILGEKASKEVCERFTREHGFDKPIYVQFGYYIAIEEAKIRNDPVACTTELLQSVFGA